MFGIFIIIVVFLPLFTLEGFEGKMFSPLAFTISFALFGSLILFADARADALHVLSQAKPHEHDRFTSAG